MDKPLTRMQSYNEIPYTRNIYPHTQPNTLATLAFLLDHQPPDISRCHVLELGCAQGFNLIAMAQAIPQGLFIGIDHSATQIELGQSVIAQLNLTNIQLKCLDLQQMTAEFGTFDYIIAHGVYSWIAPELQQQLLRICHDNLHKNGIAYVSYNTFPGWQMDAMLRELLLFHLQNLNSPTERLYQAKQFIKSLSHAVAHRYDSYALSLKNKLHYLLQIPDNYFAHEHLEEFNQAVFFHQFIQQVNRHNLHYLTDLQTYGDMPAEVMTEDALAQQQYQDFLVNRRYRETLVCRQLTNPSARFNSIKIKKLYLAAALTTTATLAQIQGDEEVQFTDSAGKTIASVTLPVLKVLCHYLGAVYPKIMLFQEIITELSQKYIVKLQASDEDEILNFLLQLFVTNDLELYIYPPQFCLTVSKYPMASPLARLQSQHGEPVTNLRGDTFWLDEATQQLLPLLDGQHSFKQLMHRSQHFAIPLTSAQVQQILENLAHRRFLLA